MNEFGEPNMGNPSVRFDEGRERVGDRLLCLSINPLSPTLLDRMDWEMVTRMETNLGADGIRSCLQLIDHASAVACVRR